MLRTLFGSLPDFICIGAQKAGTTWLHSQLSQHPEVYVSKIKELDYFIDPSKTLAWYKRQFRGANSLQITGELSPNYMPRVDPASIAALVPNVKLICMLRNPIDRAFSQWKMARRLGKIPKSQTFVHAFDADARFMRTRGMYSDLIESFEKYFPLQSQLGVFFFEDIEARPEALVRSIFKYLGVDTEFVPSHLHTKVYASSSSEEISELDRKKVTEFYIPNVAKLEDRLGRDLSSWI